MSLFVTPSCMLFCLWRVTESPRAIDLNRVWTGIRPMSFRVACLRWSLRHIMHFAIILPLKSQTTTELTKIRFRLWTWAVAALTWAELWALSMLMGQLDFAQRPSFGPLRIGYSFCILEGGWTFWTPRSILVFGVLQLRVHWFGRLHLEVLASEVQHLHIPQNGLCALLFL
jgi:hypothetical protein